MASAEYFDHAARVAVRLRMDAVHKRLQASQSGDDCARRMRAGQAVSVIYRLARRAARQALKAEAFEDAATVVLRYDPTAVADLVRYCEAWAAQCRRADDEVAELRRRLDGRVARSPERVQ